MTTQNFNAPEDLVPKDDYTENDGTPKMADTAGDDDDDIEDDDMEEDDTDDDDTDDEEGFTTLPSNDSGISADDNAATGKMHEKEGE